MKQPIRILIADDHAIVRHGLRLMLDQKSGIEVVGEAKDGAEAISLAAALKPDVIIMDLEMPRVDGIQATAAIRAEHPEIRILVLTSFTDSGKIASAIKSGAAGYVLKDSPPGDLVQAIQDVAHGQINLSPEVAQKLVEGLQQSPESAPAAGTLTVRELEVLRLAACGLANPAIAGRLVISEGTVRFHLSNIFDKLGVNNRSQAIVLALRQGLVKLDE